MAAALGRVAVARLVGSSVVRAVGRTAVFPSMQRSFASVPHMSDKLVHVTFSNNAGESLRVPALEGQSIYEVALQHDVKVGDVYTCHVILSPDSYAAHDKPLDEENTQLEGFEDLRTPTSRMASFLKLSAAVPETLVAITPQRDTAQP
eukprot:CAMPEP_0179451970 /NCGR_PEP_ID=MMETSP0799-20121207/35962_1 /TAXON_ID=46947 /ORGANISM="Geminigera cryophila, Strain CCMP2564" /LENGTH=147 /DNA_ID=CAMNT_0021247637 /DNA_START=12 /DNA_END=455 /DNA_ORIENTATION=+